MNLSLLVKSSQETVLGGAIIYMIAHFYLRLQDLERSIRDGSQ